MLNVEDYVDLSISLFHHVMTFVFVVCSRKEKTNNHGEKQVTI